MNKEVSDLSFQAFSSLLLTELPETIASLAERSISDAAKLSVLRGYLLARGGYTLKDAEDD